MKKSITNFTVISNTRLSSTQFLLELSSDLYLFDILPGQFVNAKVEDSPQTYLRRPFSIHSVDTERNVLFLLIKEMGIGSKKLGFLKKGDVLNLILPLGNSFSLENVQNALLVGGGCGVAPLLFLAQQLLVKNIRCDILLGGRSADDIVEVDEYKKYGNVHITTDDGSLGEKGFVTQHPIFNTNAVWDRIYTCGPEPMMKAVARYANQHNTDCEVSLENTMACGIGSCLCCVTDTLEGNVCVCTEGPVFNIKRLKWQI
ncbi:MAG: dihydroorotate dehydrogenase electron transfer subunit [Bacteroidota bacterium]